MPTQTQLERIFTELVKAAHADTQSLTTIQKYLDLALDAQGRADLCLLWAEYESELIHDCLSLEDTRQAALVAKSKNPQNLSQLTARLHKQEILLAKVADAAILFQLVDEHNLRGQLFFLKNFKN